MLSPDNFYTSPRKPFVAIPNDPRPPAPSAAHGVSVYKIPKHLQERAESKSDALVEIVVDYKADHWYMKRWQQYRQLRKVYGEDYANLHRPMPPTNPRKVRERAERDKAVLGPPTASKIATLEPSPSSVLVPHHQRPLTLRLYILRGITSIQGHSEPGIWSKTARSAASTTFVVSADASLASLAPQLGVPIGSLWLLSPRSLQSTALYLAHHRPLTAYQSNQPLSTVITQHSGPQDPPGGQLDVWLWSDDRALAKPEKGAGVMLPLVVKSSGGGVLSVEWIRPNRMIANVFGLLGSVVQSHSTKFLVEKEDAEGNRAMLPVRRSWSENGIMAGDVVVVTPVGQASSIREHGTGAGK